MFCHKFLLPFLLGAICILMIYPLARAGEPALPAGLAEDQGQESKAPALPTGLGGNSSGEEPDLRSGLEGGSPDEEPGLPSGLGDEPDKEPALPTGLISGEPEQEEKKKARLTAGWRDKLPFPLNGYLEDRIGPRLFSDPNQSKGATLAETRFQVKTEKYWAFGGLDLAADFVLDAVTEEADFDLRQFRFTFSPLASVDVRAGRQVLSWGTGDLLFVNDLFPKDWISFLIGRDEEYLKAPGDAVRIGWFTDLFNFNFVYTPQFDPDRYIDGERLSYWNPGLGNIAGEDARIETIEPDEWFEDDEFALRFYKTIAGCELALYGYFGFWKSPAGQDAITGRGVFPKLNVYGGSIQGTIGPGIGNVEFGYYDSRQDHSGDDPFINNSELRFLVGYEQELAKEFTCRFQYYLEHMQDRENYRKNLPAGAKEKDENRHLLALRLTKLLFNQDLTLSLVTFFSPSDQDVYIRPKATYEINDSWTVESGGNIFAGDDDHTFFSQFEDNSNWYLSLRIAF